MKLGTLTVFDLDDTLFSSRACLYVKDSDGNRFTVPSSSTYELQPGESFDYGEFRSSKLFFDTAVPIDKMVRKFKRIRSSKVNVFSRIVIVTARADFDNRDLFLSALDRYGVYHKDIHVYRAGNREDIATTPQRKVHVIRELISKGHYKKVRMFDDCYRNLRAFLEEGANHDIKFEAWHVNHKGNVSRFRV